MVGGDELIDKERESERVRESESGGVRKIFAKSKMRHGVQIFLPS